jgi:phospholipid/cholesterol/gamma-HCH transport system permease protein
LELSGCWTFNANRPSVTAVLDKVARDPSFKLLVVKAERVSDWDTALLTFLVALNEELANRDITVDLSSLPEGIRSLLKLSEAVPERQGARRASKRPPLLERIGVQTLSVAAGAARAVRFIGETALGCLALLRGKTQFRRVDFLQFVQEAGALALPIVSLISVLIGLILAFVGAVQLKLFGAEIYVANLVGVGMAAEMGALMTGIIMAGRTGAAYAAQLGTMQVNEEIDALSTMGISPFEFLVLPRMLALVLMMPLLCIYADILGVLGGAIVGIGILDILPEQYFNQTINAVQLRHVAQGLIKACTFGVVIALGGCYHGIHCGRSAQAVGEATTKAVVQCIVWIVVTDSLLTIIYNVTGF